MTYALWVVVTFLLVFVAGAVVWILKQSPEGVEKDDGDLTEWTCPSCGFHVQLGKECIYCGERKPG